MFEPTQRSVDHDLDAFMDMFQRAQVGEVTPVQPRRPEHVLLALDGSTQDELGTAIARGLGERFGCRLSVLDGRENTTDNALPSPHTPLPEGEGLGVRVAEMLQATALPKAADDAFDQILAAVDETGCDLVIVPCPFGRDLEKIGPDSSGTVIDVLLSRSPVPLLVLRRPYEPKGPLFDQVLMVLLGENDAAPLAAEWAAGLVAPEGRSQLVLVLEEEYFENLKHLMKALDPDLEVTPQSISEALAKSQARLHRRLQKSAAETGIDYRLSVQREDEAGPLNVADEAKHPLLIVALERSDRMSRGHVEDRIRHSRHPVLVVPAGDKPVERA